MRTWLGLWIALAICAPGAMAQTPIDANDPSITARPKLDVQRGAIPSYPQEARRKGLHGEVKIKTCVDVSGKPYDGEIAESSGHPLLDDTSLSWINDGARFKPAEVDGKPVATCNYVFTYVWSLPPGSHRADATSDYEEASALPPQDRPVVLARPAQPAYPPGALARRASGTVRYSMCIGPDGKLARMTVIGADPDLELAMATMPWFMGTTYKPGQKDGKPVGVCGFEEEFTWQLPTAQPRSSTL